MVASNILLTTAKITVLDAQEQSRVSGSLSATLKWRGGKLWVNDLKPDLTQSLPALSNKLWLKNCLDRSPVQAVCLDRKLDQTELKHWADACHQAGKQTFLRIPTEAELPQKSAGISWQLKRTMDWAAAAVLVTILSPLLLALAFLVRYSSPGPIFFQQWRVGERGKLFRIIKFRTMVVNAEQMHHQIMGTQQGLHKCKDDPRVTAVGRWMRKYSLDELPQLFNVLRGEMSLVGPRPWALYDAVRISEKHQRRLNALPGITGAWQVEARSNLLDLDAVNQLDLTYLTSWSIQTDLKLLLRTIPKVIAGFGAY